MLSPSQNLFPKKRLKIPNSGSGRNTKGLSGFYQQINHNTNSNFVFDTNLLLSILNENSQKMKPKSRPKTSNISYENSKRRNISTLNTTKSRYSQNNSIIGNNTSKSTNPKININQRYINDYQQKDKNNFYKPQITKSKSKLNYSYGKYSNEINFSNLNSTNKKEKRNLSYRTIKNNTSNRKDNNLYFSNPNNTIDASPACNLYNSPKKSAKKGHKKCNSFSAYDYPLTEKNKIQTGNKFRNMTHNEFYKNGLGNTLNERDNKSGMNFEKYSQVLKGKIEVLNLEIGTLKIEKQKLENKIMNITDRQTYQRIQKLENEIQNFREVIKKYKTNCSELTHEICNLQEQIKRITFQNPMLINNK